MSMGANFHYRGHVEEAMQYLRRAEEAYIAAGATSGSDYGTLLMSIGMNLLEREQKEVAMTYLRRAEKVYITAGATNDPYCINLRDFLSRR